MKIVVLNGSPKGEYSITLQYVKYLEKLYTAHSFTIIHVSKKIKKLEKNNNYFNEVIEELKEADAILWSFGLWVLAVPAQYMRFIELVYERSMITVFADKYTAALSTSIQFYDHTAHNYIRASCEDLGMKYVSGISFYMLNFTREEKRQDLRLFFEELVNSVNSGRSTGRLFSPLQPGEFDYNSSNGQLKLSTTKKILVLADHIEKDTNLERMISRFRDAYTEPPELICLDSIHIEGACLGCMKCGYDYQCHYKDGFKEFYNNKVRNADVLIFAGTMKGRFLSSLWKTFFDRAYFWNHTPSLAGKQIAYLISGPISQNHNLQQILEGNVTARQSANLVDIVSDEAGDSKIIDSNLQALAERVVLYAEKGFIRPQNFLKVGGHKIFRDEIFGHIRSVWQADHRYYRKHGLYDFEQKKHGLRIMNFFLLAACKIPAFRKKYYQNIMKLPAKRFEKITDKLIQVNQARLN